MTEKIQKGGELNPEVIEEAGILPTHAGEGWEMDRGAIPGEVCATYKDRIGITEIENDQGDKAIYEVGDLQEGKPVARFSHMVDAAEFGKKYYDSLREPWQRTQREIMDQARKSKGWSTKTSGGWRSKTFTGVVSEHRAAVKEALKEGKPVPEEVLKS
jgi:hypothetical protein